MTSRNITGRKMPSTDGALRPLPVTTYAVLGQLAGGPSSGYEIKARLEAGAAHFWHASYSQIYAELRRLTELGLAGEEHVLQDARPNKRVYTITPAGRRAVAGAFHEQAPHRDGRDRDEVTSVLPLHRFFARQPQVGLVHELGRLHRPRLLPADVPLCQAPQLGIHVTDELVHPRVGHGGTL